MSFFANFAGLWAFLRLSDSEMEVLLVHKLNKWNKAMRVERRGVNN